MFTAIAPKLPMRNKAVTREFYLVQLGFEDIGSADYPEYLILRKENIELHFFKFAELDPQENYGQVYIRVDDIDELYRSMQTRNNYFPPGGHLQTKPWGQREFSLRDPDNNLLTFGQAVIQ